MVELDEHKLVSADSPHLQQAKLTGFQSTDVLKYHLPANQSHFYHHGKSFDARSLQHYHHSETRKFETITDAGPAVHDSSEAYKSDKL